MPALFKRFVLTERTFFRYLSLCLLYGALRFTEGYIFPFFRSYLTNLPLLWYNISCTYLLFLHVFFGPLAQLVEQLTLNQWVLGSSPRWCTTKQPYGKRKAVF